MTAGDAALEAFMSLSRATPPSQSLQQGGGRYDDSCARCTPDQRYPNVRPAAPDPNPFAGLMRA